MAPPDEVIQPSAQAPSGEQLPPNLEGAAGDLQTQFEAQRREIESLSSRMRQLEALIHSTPAVIYMKDAEGRYLLINQTFSERFHVGGDEIIGRTDAEVFPAEMAERFRENDLEVLVSSHGTQFEEIAPHDDGPHTYLSLKVPLIDPLTGAKAIGGISTDISDAKRFEQELQESQKLFASLVETLPVALFRKNLAGELTFVNQRFCQYVGRGEADLLGHTDEELFSEELAEKYRADDAKVVSEEALCDEVEEQETRSGERRYVHVIKSPVYDARRRVIGVQGLFWDETERREAEQALRKMALELARSNRELENFAYVASHDLQEPLRKVIAYGARAAARESTLNDPVARDAIERMTGAADRMRTMIDDLLALSQVTTARRAFEWVDLNAIAEEVLDTLEVAIDELGATIKMDRLPSIEGDPVQLRQLFQNLIGNGLKYRRAGVSPVMEIRAARSPVEAAAYGAREECGLTFADNGRGFDDRHRERIFEPFERLHSADELPGSGIGLAICRRIVDRHEGQISAQGRLGEGATFRVTLPIHHSARTAALDSAAL